MPEAPILRFTHRGLVVDELGESLRFFAGAAKFAPIGRVESVRGEQAVSLSGIAGARFDRWFAGDADGNRLEFRRFYHPAAEGARERRPLNEIGLTHLAIWVSDLDGALARVAESGGTVHTQTRATFPEAGVTMVYCTDPSGVRLEIQHGQGKGDSFTHSGICVADEAGSLAFYAGLGFTAAESFDFSEGSEWLDVINEKPRTRIRAWMLRDTAGNTIELLHHVAGDVTGKTSRPPPSQRGLAFLAFQAPDLSDAAALIRDLGGMTYERSDGVLHGADPNGVRLVVGADGTAAAPSSIL